MHADLITGRQINRTIGIKELGILVNENINPPCNGYAINWLKMSSEEEASVTFPFSGNVSSAGEGDLTIDEDASTISLFANPPVVPNLSIGGRRMREESAGGS